jgi:hypothetical protein
MSEIEKEMLSLKGQARKKMNWVDLNPKDANYNKTFEELIFFPTDKFLSCPESLK